MNRARCKGCFYYRTLGGSYKACHYALFTGKCISTIPGAGPNSENCIMRQTPSDVIHNMRQKVTGFDMPMAQFLKPYGRSKAKGDEADGNE